MSNAELRVLLIEDDADEAAAIRDLLSGIPGDEIRISWSRDFDSALGMLVAKGYDISLVGYRLGTHDGLELVREARSRGSDTPIILLTANDARDLALQALEAGAADYLVRGRFDAAALERSIRYTLQQKRHADDLERQVADRTSELRKTNLDLQTSEERYRLLVEGATGFAIIMLDLEGRVTTWNVGAERLLGYQEQEVLGTGFSRFFTPEDVAAGRPERELKNAAATEIGSDDNLLVRKDGTRFWASGATTALRDETGQLRAYSKIVRDVTERKRAEEALQEADRHKNEHLAMLAHELRNPLGAIANATRVIRMAHDKPSTVAAASVTLERQTAQMVRLVDDLLDITRISQGKIELRLQRVDLGSAMSLAAETARALSHGADVELIVELPQPPVLLYADPARLAQIIGNLLHNACKFTDKGGVVTLSGGIEEGEAVIRVRDSGIGIAADQLTKIFEMFAQVDRSLERSRGGLGIGLTLVRHLAELHGGSVEAHSDGIGKGSEFVLRLPLMNAATEADAAPQREPASRARLVRRRVLVVDDNRDAADSLAMILEMLGHEARAVYDGIDAIEAARTFLPDVVLLDIGLPRLNGYDAARRIGAEAWSRDMVLVALTGWGQQEDRDRARHAGFQGHLIKPVDQAALDALLAELPHQRMQ